MMKHYDSYKDSGIEWVGEIPSHWEVSKGKYILDILTGNYPSEIIDDEEGEYYVKVDDLNSIEGNYYLSNPKMKIKELGLNPLEEGIILFPKRGMTIFTNKVVITKSRCFIDPNLMGIKVDDSFNKIYLFYLLTNRGLGDICDSSTIPQINNKHVYPLEFINPPLSEQEHIVSYLDDKTTKIDELIQKKLRKIDLLKEYRTSLINTVVTKGLNPNVPMKDSGIEWIGEIPDEWKKGRLGYYSNVYRGSGYQYLNQVDEDYSGRKEKVVRISDITEFNPIWCEYLEQFENYRIKKDEILIGGTGHYFGKSIFVTEEMEGLIHSYNIIRLVVKEQYSKYIQYYISSPMIREQMDMSVLGSGQPFIDLQGLKNLTILIPKFNEQLKIVEYLDSKTKEIDDLVSLEQRKIDTLKEYRQSLISEVVTGKIKVVSE
jgi:type I restriction enzyme S subunit